MSFLITTIQVILIYYLDIIIDDDKNIIPKYNINLEIYDNKLVFHKLYGIFDERLNIYNKKQYNIESKYDQFNDFTIELNKDLNVIYTNALIELQYNDYIQLLCKHPNDYIILKEIFDNNTKTIN